MLKHTKRIRGSLLKGVLEKIPREVFGRGRIMIFKKHNNSSNIIIIKKYTVKLDQKICSTIEQNNLNREQVMCSIWEQVT